MACYRIYRNNKSIIFSFAFLTITQYFRWDFIARFLVWSSRHSLQRTMVNLPWTKQIMPENPWLLRGIIVGIFIGVAFVSVIAQGRTRTSINADISHVSAQNPASACNSSSSAGTSRFRDRWIPPQVSNALLHYATTKVIPQQNRGEIMLSFRVLAARSPCNFLVFGLGHDSTLWNALNLRGNTVFLEEDSNWMKEILKSHPELKAYHVKYPTRLSQADSLLEYYRSATRSCAPMKGLVGSDCKLALTNLPKKIYTTEWDVIMIDAPRGFFDAAPGRMAAIYSAAVMARNRKKEGMTDVFLHDVNRRVEKMYANEFLCKRNLVGSSGRLWHFMIAPLNALGKKTSTGFCNP
eukprot:Gb_12265 [translate_table: standard]